MLTQKYSFEPFARPATENCESDFIKSDQMEILTDG